MIASVALNGSLGFGMVLATLFCLGDVDSVLATATGFPFIQVFRNATGSNVGASAMVCFRICNVVPQSWHLFRFLCVADQVNYT